MLQKRELSIKNVVEMFRHIAAEAEGIAGYGWGEAGKVNAANKDADYPMLWLEFPVLINTSFGTPPTGTAQKVLSFGVWLLTKASKGQAPQINEPIPYGDQPDHRRKMEQLDNLDAIGEGVMQLLSEKMKQPLGWSLENNSYSATTFMQVFSDDDVGIRYDIGLTGAPPVNRCDILFAEDFSVKGFDCQP